MLRMLDLFSGIGGFSLAASWTGCIETVAFCEIEPYCQKVLAKHWPDVEIYSDIKELSGDDVVTKHGAIDIVCGGFPCQPFSCAGKQRGKEDDRYLWPEMFRIIQETKPTWVIGENVPGLINLGLEDCFLDLEAEGYEVQPLIIPACGVNAPHRRDRVWIMAHANSDRWREMPQRFFGQTDRDRRSAREENAANADIQRLPAGGCPGEAGRHILGGYGHVSYADGERFSAQWVQGGLRETQRKTRSGVERRSLLGEGWHSEGRSTESGMGGMVDGISAWLDGYWDVEPDIPRIAKGIPSRAPRLKALGNAIVPQVVYPIFQGIVEIERSAQCLIS